MSRPRAEWSEARLPQAGQKQDGSDRPPEEQLLHGASAAPARKLDRGAESAQRSAGRSSSASPLEQEELAFGGGHVLEVHGLSPEVTTAHLEVWLDPLCEGLGAPVKPVIRRASAAICGRKGPGKGASRRLGRKPPAAACRGEAHN